MVSLNMQLLDSGLRVYFGTDRGSSGLQSGVSQFNFTMKPFFDVKELRETSINLYTQLKLDQNKGEL